MLKVDYLPARFGDCIWIDYGNNDEKHHVLIDGGTRGTRNDIRDHLIATQQERPHIDLIVVTHIDRDHIEGILGLMEQDDPGFSVGDIWFNGWNHLPDNPEDEHFGAVMGEKLTASILKQEWNWNKAFDGKPVLMKPGEELPEINLPGDMKITLLSPTPIKLADLKPKWDDEVREANLDPGFGLEPYDEDDNDADDEDFGVDELPDVENLADTPFEEDDKEANGSSIALLVEFDGQRLLLAADASPSVLLPSLNLLSLGSPLDVDLFQVPHHGSEHNLSTELLEKVNCSKFVFSTNGSIYHHPHQVAVSRVIMHGGENPELIFNYRSNYNTIWEESALQDLYGYSTQYPDVGAIGIRAYP